MFHKINTFLQLSEHRQIHDGGLLREMYGRLPSNTPEHKAVDENFLLLNLLEKKIPALFSFQYLFMCPIATTETKLSWRVYFHTTSVVAFYFSLRSKLSNWCSITFHSVSTQACLLSVRQWFQTFCNEAHAKIPIPTLISLQYRIMLSVTLWIFVLLLWWDETIFDSPF